VHSLFAALVLLWMGLSTLMRGQAPSFHLSFKARRLHPFSSYHSYRPPNVTKTVTNGQISVTFAIDGLFFALALESCSTQTVPFLRRPLDTERGRKQAGSLKVMLVANGKTEPVLSFLPPQLTLDFCIRHQYQSRGEPHM